MEALNSHYKPQVVVIYERFKFYSRNQETNENISNYVAAIKSNASTCEFGANLEEMLRDRFVMGLRDQATQRALLTTKDLTFTMAVELASAREAAAKDVKAFGAHSSNNATQSVNTVKYQNHKSNTSGNKHLGKKSNNTSTQSNQKVESGNLTKPTKPCSGCGSLHWKRHCPFKAAECRKCKKVGHIAKVCFTKTQVNEVSEQIETDSNPMLNFSNEYVFYGENTVNSIRPYINQSDSSV